MDGDRSNIVTLTHTVLRARYGLAVINLAEFRIPWVIPGPVLREFPSKCLVECLKAHLHVHFFKISSDSDEQSGLRILD